MMVPAMVSTDPQSIFISAPDGLRLHARCHGRPSAEAIPVVCLPGLARTTEDFDLLAAVLANQDGRPRRVVALDYRGRGLSDYDRDAANYSFQTELADLLAVLTALDCLPAIFVGTSRGGILTMLLAALRPTAIAGTVLNDIGPVIEAKGLMRIKGYIGKLPEPRTYDEAAEILRRLFDAQFPKLGTEDWLAYARRSFRLENGRLKPTYDVNLAKTLEGVNFEQPLPPLWASFDALGHAPMMVIRGVNSDILAASTVEAMRARRCSLEAIEVPDQGHAPLLAEDDVIERIVDFVGRCDQAPRREPAST
jgi:pimeloyl-ACP methyl ester carboxylesterase